MFELNFNIFDFKQNFCNIDFKEFIYYKLIIYNILAYLNKKIAIIAV